MVLQPSINTTFWRRTRLMARPAKRTVNVALRNTDANDEALVTAFTGAEPLLNSRPLTY